MHAQKMKMIIHRAEKKTRNRAVTVQNRATRLKKTNRQNTMKLDQYPLLIAETHKNLLLKNIVKR